MKREPITDPEGNEINTAEDLIKHLRKLLLKNDLPDEDRKFIERALKDTEKCGKEVMQN